MPFDAAGYLDTQTERDLAVLRAARDGIAQPGGWLQGDYGEDGRYCAMGWLFAVGGRGEGYRRRLLKPALPVAWRIFGCVSWYNDAPWRRQSTMVDLFDRAIRRLEASRSRQMA